MKNKLEDLIDLSKYKPPVEIYMGDMDVVSFTKKVENELDNEICYEIRQKFCVDGSNEELMKALNYDRHQYEVGYRDGLNDGLEKAAATPWLPYPEEKPEKNGHYLAVLVDDDGWRSYDWAFYGPKDHWTSPTPGNVIYWAKVKFPKRKEKTNESE